MKTAKQTSVRAKNQRGSRYPSRAPHGDTGASSPQDPDAHG